MWRVLQLLWQREYQTMWQALDRPWSAPLQPVMAALAEKLRAELLELLATAYSSVKVSKVASLCGYTEEDARTGQLRRWSRVVGWCGERVKPAEKGGLHVSLTALSSVAGSARARRRRRAVRLPPLLSVCANAACLAAGWVWHEASGTLQVAKAPPPAVPADEHLALARLTNYMVHLEH